MTTNPPTDTYEISHDNGQSWRPVQFKTMCNNLMNDGLDTHGALDAIWDGKSVQAGKVLYRQVVELPEGEASQ